MQKIEVIATENYFYVLIHFSAYIIIAIFKTKKYKGGGYGEGACPSPLHLKNK